MMPEYFNLRELRFAAVILVGLASLLLAMPANGQDVSKSHPIWVSAYYPNWIQRYGSLKPSDIDYTAFTHLIQFSIVPNPNGSINSDTDKTVTADQSAAVIGPAHAAGDKVLICVGGENTASVFGPAISDSTRATTVQNIVQFVVERGYHGVDIDYEPLKDADVPNYEKFIRDLRQALNQAKPGLLLTAAVANQPELFARLQDQFDQINLMTYALSGPWPGWITWFDSPLSSGKTLFSDGKPPPSARGMVDTFIKAGVNRAKLGIGIDFNGLIWNGVDGPRQSIQGVTTQGISYHEIMDKYFHPALYHWDKDALAPYLSIDSPSKMFIAYDDERACKEKIAYVRKARLGGAILWELGGGWRDSQPPGQRDLLLQSVKQARRNSP
jgi:chitinase